MITTSKPRVLVVDDEPNVLESIRRTLRRTHDVHTASCGEVALRALASIGPVALVISDLQMRGMNGVELLRRISTSHPDTVRVLLTGRADVQTAIDVVNRANVFRFLTKPCPTPELVACVDAAIAQHELVVAERVMREDTLTAMIQTMSEMLALANPAAFARAMRVRQSATQLASSLAPSQVWATQNAALLAQMGSITLPHETAEKIYRGIELTPKEQEMAVKAPELAVRLLGEIPRLEEIHDVVVFQSALFDGRNSPKAEIRGEAIPFGARVIKIAHDYDVLESQGHSAASAARTMASRSGWYDPKILPAFLAMRGVMQRRRVRTSVQLSQLVPGMVVAMDLRTTSGQLLVASGLEVTPGLQAQINNYASHGAIRGPVAVLVEQGATA